MGVPAFLRGKLRACPVEADIESTVRALFRKGNPTAKGKPSRTAEVRRDNGWFGGADKAPSIPRDPNVISEEDLSIYTSALSRNGFFGPDSWYMKAAANIAYATQATNGGKLALPVLFLHGACDYTCETIDSRLAEPMRRSCADLTEVVIPLRPLDGAGATRRGQRRAGKVACHKSA
jgi:hypothetical protein